MIGMKHNSFRQGPSNKPQSHSLCKSSTILESKIQILAAKIGHTLSLNNENIYFHIAEWRVRTFDINKRFDNNNMWFNFSSHVFYLYCLLDVLLRDHPCLGSPSLTLGDDCVRDDLPWGALRHDCLATRCHLITQTTINWKNIYC